MTSKIPWHSLGRFALILICVILVLALVVVVLPIHLDVSAFRGPIEQALSDLAGAPVTVAGELRLHPSPWPSLRITEIEIAARDGESAAPFARIDRAEIQISAIALLRNQLRLQRFLLSGAVFHAHRPAGRHGNWPVWEESDLAIRELAGIELEDVTLLLEDDLTVRAKLVVDELTCDIAANRPLDLDLRGSLQELPIRLTAGGPTLAVPFSQASDFPLQLTLGLADLTARLDGSASREPSGTRFRFAFDLESPDLAFLRQLLEHQIPLVGGARLSGVLSNRGAWLELDDLEGAVAGTTIHGRLKVDRPSERPSITGRFSLGELDLEPWLGTAPASASDPPAPLPWSILSAADVDLKLGLQRVSGLAHDLTEIDLDVELVAGDLTAPGSFRLAGIPVTANLAIRTDEDAPEIVAHAHTENLRTEQLAPLFEIPAGVAGRAAAVDLLVSSRGQTRAALERNLLLEVSLDQAVLEIADESREAPITTTLSRVVATHRPGTPLSVRAQGSLFEEPFTLALETAPGDEILELSDWPIEVDLESAGAVLELAGLLERQPYGLAAELGFDLSGERLGELDNWLDLPAQSDLAYQFRGRFTSADGTRRLHLDPSFLGSSRFTGDLTWSSDDSTDPLRVELHATTLDLRELREPSSAIATLDTHEQALGIDVPLLPSELHMHDAEIELRADRLLRDTVDLTDIAADLHIRQGHLVQSPFSFSYETQRMAGTLELDLRAETPRFILDLRGEGERLGEFLDREGFVDGFEVGARQIELRIDAEGRTVRELLQSAGLSGRVTDVSWEIQPPELEDPLKIHLDQVDLRGPRDKPIELSASGRLDGVPLEVHLEARIPEHRRREAGEVMPFAVDLRLAETQVALAGEIELPIRNAQLDMAMVVEGQSMTTLSPLVHRKLPEVGPYRLDALLSFKDAGVSLTDLDFTLGESDIRGEIHYQRRNERPTFSATLSSELLRMQDLRGPPATPAAGEEARLQEVPDSRSTLEMFNGFDASIDLTAHRIVTTGGEVDKLMLVTELDHGSLDFAIRRPQSSGDQAELTAKIRPWGEGIETDLRAKWDRQPYGLVADILNPDAGGGAWGVDLSLSSRGIDLDELTANLSGHLYFVDYPNDLNATLFDLWGGGLVNSLLPVFQLGTASRVNCSIGKFQVDRGIFTPESLVIDTTRSRVTGKGTIDLPLRAIDLRLKPRPKQRSLINLSMPVKIGGTLADPEVQISRSGAAVTFFRLSLWVYTVWRDIFRQPLPADGSDVCLDPFGSAAD